MADFSVKSTELQSQIEPSATLVEPISRQNEVTALSQIGQGVAQGASTLGALFKSQKVDDGAKSLSDFSIKLNDLADAFDQGAISAADFGMRRRALLKQNLANNPSLEEDYLKRYSTFREQNGLSGVDSSGVQAAKLRQDAVQGAVNNGFLPIASVGNQEAEDRAIQDAAQFQVSARQLEEQSKRLSVESSKLELGSKLRQAKEQEAKQVVQDGLAKIGRDGLPYWRTQYENIKARARSATSELDRNKIITEGVAAMEQDYAQRAASISGDTLGIEQGKIDQILKPQADLIDAYKRELTGQYDTDTFNRYVDAAQARSKALAMEGLDDNTKQWIALSEIAKSAPGVFNQQIQNGLANAFSKNAKASQSGNSDGQRTKPYDVLPSSDEETTNVKNYLGTIQKMLEDKSAGKFSRQSAEQQKQLDTEIDDQLKSVLKSVSVNSSAAESAKEFQPVIDFFASAAVGEYLKGKGLDPTLQANVATVLQNGYASQVVPMLKEALGGSQFESVMVDGIDIPFTSLAQPTFENGQFGFKLNPEYGAGVGTFRPPVAQQRINTLVRNANSSSFVKVLNKMIAADANIRGDGDKLKSWTETFQPAIFPAEQGDAGGEGTSVDQMQTGSVVSNYVDPAVAAPNAAAQAIEDADVGGETPAENADFNLDDLVRMDNFSVPNESGTLNEGLKKAASGTFTGKADNFIGKTDPIEIASSFKGMNEKEHSAVIGSFIRKAAGQNINPASTAWCAAFVNAVLGASGSKGTGKLNARSFLDWGVATNSPSQGDVVVFSRGNANGWQGHVGFYVGTETKNGKQYIKVLGGNQGNSVKESSYPADRLLGFRRAA